MDYCPSIYQSRRFKTRVVYVGKVAVGGENPIRLQSMTTSNTRDVDATVDQIMRLADRGCEIARLTVQGKKEAEACEGIKNGLLQRGYTIPLVADIHFYPPAAMLVAEFVDKVRVNPGNYVDRRASFKVIEYDDAAYQREIDRIEEGFSPLVLKCKQLKKAMRIGTNHGSLSDRIMNRYGDTPKGMVESALEFARVCRRHDYHDIIFSMKASNPIVMIAAYRLLAAEMLKLGWDYPLHLGVTEAGEGEDGRVKSSIGIGTLLLDGLGDTIRVSLTEDPWAEIDPCQRLARFHASHLGKGTVPFIEKKRDFQNISRRKTESMPGVSLNPDGSVFLSVSSEELLMNDFFARIGCKMVLGRPQKELCTIDGIILDTYPKNDQAKKVLQALSRIGIHILSFDHKNGIIPIVTLKDLPTKAKGPFALLLDTDEMQEWEKLSEFSPVLVLLRPKNSRLHSSRRFIDFIKEKGFSFPVLLSFDYTCDIHDLVIQASAECGALLCDGLGDGIALQTQADLSQIYSLSFSILQGSRMRTIKTEFISCPGCGRTLFDLQQVSKRIREKTSHLPGVKIAIMGCIVNGPGEMADADFGYVGSKPEKVDLYVGKTCVEKDIDFSEADERLIALIKAHGKWKDPEPKEASTEPLLQSV